MTSFTSKTTAAEVASSFSSQIRGKTIVITGVSPNGLGEETARAIAHHQPALIVLASRSKANLEKVRTGLQKDNPTVEMRMEVLDLSSQTSVRQAANRINAYNEKIDVLINNAGIMAPPFSKTVDGLESQFGTNHIGHFLFTNLIMPRILAANKGARIVTLSSAAHRWGGIQWNDYNFEHTAYDPFIAYAQSKSANALFTISLSEKLKSSGVLAFSVHPGNVLTNLGRDIPQEKLEDLHAQIESGAMSIKTIPEGAATQLLAAFDPSLKASSGQYLEDCQVAPIQVDWAKGSENAEKLWRLSEITVGQEFVYES